MSHLILRADGSTQLGMGHLVRMVGLAGAVHEHGMTATLVTRAIDEGSHPVLLDRDLDVERLPAGITIGEDAERTLRIAEDRDASAFVTDLVNREHATHMDPLTRYHRELRSRCPVAAFTETEHRLIGADLVVEPYVHAPPSENEELPRVLAGPDHFVLPPDHVESRLVDGAVRSKARRIVVSIGGSDPADLTPLVVRGTRLLDAPDLEVRVVVGAGFGADRAAKISGSMDGMDPAPELVQDPASLAPHLAWADVAVIGDGLTKYEAAHMGTPALIVPRPDSDTAINEAFDEAGTAELLPPPPKLTPEALANALAGLRDDVDRRSRMAANGRALVDGRGAARVVQALKEMIHDDH